MKEFTGTLLFKEYHYYDRLTRDLTDTSITYFTFDIRTNSFDSEVELTQFYSSQNEFKETKFLRFNFTKRNDSLFLKYFDPTDLSWQLEYIFPLNKRDTISPCKGYRIGIDSIYGKKKTLDFTYNEPCYNNTYLKDTIIKFKDYEFDCFVIEQNYNYHRNQMRVRKKTYIDKLSLVPVYESEHTFAQRMGRLIPTNKWVLTGQMKLIKVD